MYTSILVMVFNGNGLKRYAPKIILGLFICLHLVLLSKTFFTDSAGAMHTTYQGYGDIPLHMTQVAKFAGPEWRNLNEPIYVGEKLKYPFLINFVSGVLLRAAGSWTFAMQAPAFLCVIFSALFLFLLFRKLLKNEWYALIGILFVYLAGGWGVTLIHSVGDLLKESFSTVTELSVVYPQQPLVYGAPITLDLLHTRSFLIGLFLVSLSLFLLEKIWSGNRRLSVMLGAIISIGILPIAHAHGFLAVGTFLVILFGLSLCGASKRALSKRLFVVGLGALLMAVPQLYFLLSSTGSGVRSGFALFRVGFMIESGIGGILFPSGTPRSVLSLEYAKFLWMNFGLLPLFVFSSLVFLIKNIRTAFREHGFVCALSASGVFLVIATFLVKFQPWDYDNGKMIIYAMLFFTPGIFLCVQRVFKQWQDARLLVVVLLLLVLCSGVVDIIPKFLVPYASSPVLFSPDARAVADYIIKNVPPMGVILTTDDHRNPVSSLAGRQIFIGYPGWLWTRGISYGSREKEVIEFYAHPTRHLDFLSQNHFDYILVDASVRNTWKADEAYFSSHFQKVFEAGEYVLFMVK